VISGKLLSHAGNAGGLSDVHQETSVGRAMRGHVVCWRGKRAGGRSCRASAAGCCRKAGTGIACGLGMDTRILPLERKTLHLDSGTLGGAAPASRHMGARPMGPSRWRLGLDQRILALEPPACRQQVERVCVGTCSSPAEPALSLSKGTVQPRARHGSAG
jgi:hypothetical protein